MIPGSLEDCCLKLSSIKRSEERRFLAHDRKALVQLSSLSWIVGVLQLINLQEELLGQFIYIRESCPPDE